MNEIKDGKSAGPKVLIVCVDRTQVLVFVEKISHFYHADFKNATLRGKLETEEKLVIHFDGIDCIVWTVCIIHVGLHECSKFQDSVTCEWEDIKKPL